MGTRADRTLFVFGVGDVSESSLQEYFGAFGSVEDVHIPMYTSFGFVRFAEEESALNALKNSWHTVDDQEIGIKPHKDSQLAKNSSAREADDSSEEDTSREDTDEESNEDPSDEAMESMRRIVSASLSRVDWGPLVESINTLSERLRERLESGSGLASSELEENPSGPQGVRAIDSSARALTFPSADDAEPENGSASSSGRGSACSSELETSSSTSPETTRLSIGERVVWIEGDDDPESGVVRWIGVFPRLGTENDLEQMAGIECDNEVGTGNGEFRDKQLFETKMGHAKLIPISSLLKERDFLGLGPPEEEGAVAGPAESAVENDCQICFEQQVDCAFYDCGHNLLCYKCALACMKARPSLCPICRKEIRDVIKLYR